MMYRQEVKRLQEERTLFIESDGSNKEYLQGNGQVRPS